MPKAHGLRLWLAAGLAALVSPALAQETQNTPADDGALAGSAALMRGLDKVNGRTVDVAIPVGGTAEVLGLMVTLGGCRYPADNPTGDAYAYVTIRSPQDGQVFFEGWMIASSPALSALDHNRYDIWVIRCNSN